MKLPRQRLGFGLMRLPTLESGEIDQPKVCDMVDRFLEAGFTYFDTAYFYHDGHSEGVVKEALSKRYPRDRFTVADKMVHYVLNSPEDNQKVFNEQLRRAGLSYFDYYLLHGVGNRNWERYESIGCWDFARRAKQEGLIGSLGFSFHGTPELLDKLLCTHPEAEFVQLQLNYLDWDSPTVRARECYETARAYGKPIVVMEPVKGGLLAHLPENAARPLREVNADASSASWALRYCAGLDGVAAVLSGMSDMEQVMDNTRIMRCPKPLDETETQALHETVDVLTSCPTVPCTDCRYCVKGCPAALHIPLIIKALNQYRMFGATEPFWRDLRELGDKTPDQCLECGQCEEICPQHLPIKALMQELTQAISRARYSSTK